jgi:hypothetical protein
MIEPKISAGRLILDEKINCRHAKTTALHSLASAGDLGCFPELSSSGEECRVSVGAARQAGRTSFHFRVYLRREQHIFYVT